MRMHSGEEDSGRSSCSAASVGVSPIIDFYENQHNQVLHQSKKIDLADPYQQTEKRNLTVSTRPRSCSLLKSPEERDPFPSCRIQNKPRNVVFSMFNSPRMGGLSNAHSTLEIACSTQIEEPKFTSNAISLCGITNNDIGKLKQSNIISNFRRSKPVQRAASRLYKTEGGSKGKEQCIGPEFIVRASQPAKKIDLSISLTEKKSILVVLLSGQRVDVICDPNTITAGQLFEALVQNERYEHNFMLGIAVLIGGDFVFLPDDYKLKKIAPEGWHKSTKKSKITDDEENLTVFLRIKFFLPKNIATNIQGGEWRYRVYLQLRRATVEGQMTSTLQNLILLSGYALHIEFGEFSYREHGSGDYFLLEHYLPESLISENIADIKLRMKRAHESRRELDRNVAVNNYIMLAQTFRDYGAHFYSAVWATRDGFCRDVWLSIGPRGITLYSRNIQISEETVSHTTNRIVLQCLPWHHIHTFYCNKKSLYIIPNTYSGLSKIGVKYKLKMIDNKSYFAYWLASLHHRLYLKLYAKEDFITYLSDELSCPVSSEVSSNRSICSNYQDSYNLAVRNQARTRRPPRRRFKIELFADKKAQNKENEKPNTEELLRQILLSPQANDEGSPHTQGNSSNDGLSSSESCSLPRRHGVKMGTRVFTGNRITPDNRYHKSSYTNNTFLRSECDFATTQSDSDDLSTEQRQNCNINSMKLLPERHYNHSVPDAITAYVLESPKVYSDAFNYNNIGNNESALNSSLFEKLDNMGCVQGERVFVTATVKRDETNALGLQVAEGSDGNVYIKSITPNSPADLCHNLMPGDQIISVNGITLLNLKYDKALGMLQSAPQTVELIVLQNGNRFTGVEQIPAETRDNFNQNSKLCSQKSVSLSGALDVDITDDELLNEEALKTIYTLIKLTKEKVISRMKDKTSRQNIPLESNIQRCYSEIKVNDMGENAAQDNTLHRRSTHKFNTWRGQLQNRPKRRPLSLSIPINTDLPEDYLNDDNFLHTASLKSIPSSMNSLNKSEKSSPSLKTVALPRNFGLSRKWLGPVRYPVTPCKNSKIPDNSAICDDNIIRRHFIYGAGDSDEDQIFL